MDDLIAEFLTETNEALAELDTALVQLERAPDGETLARIFRLVHTVKGTCGFFGLSRLEGWRTRPRTCSASTAMASGR
ncbi:Hpt domain-containing protein [Teichococcus aestuarii]|uniref:Hpt domain-containing protein n=1 Tax=Teichococcus aestuarii TaxID=568898 RepID=UPI00360CB0ED